jgi:hypothetical protein
MTRRRVLGGAVLWAAAVVTLTAASDVRVTPLVTDGRVLASFTVADAFPEDTEAVLESGLVLTFAFSIELKRPTTLWFDPTLARIDVSSEATYDTLTGTYQVSKRQDGQVVWSESTREQEQARAWMTEFDGLALEPGEPLEPNGDYYVRVRLFKRPRPRFSIWPWGRDDGSGRADFTFLR